MIGKLLQRLFRGRPEIIVTRDMPVGDVRYTDPSAVYHFGEGEYLNLDWSAYTSPRGRYQMKVERTHDGYVVWRSGYVENLGYGLLPKPADVRLFGGPYRVDQTRILRGRAY